MSQIRISDLTFSYNGSDEKLFENVNLILDTNWKLGIIGRNGKGKTTFLKLLMKEYEYIGNIYSSSQFEYFPYIVENEESNTLDVMKDIIAPYKKWENEMELYLGLNTIESLERFGHIQELYMKHDGYIIDDCIKIELGKMNITQTVLERKYKTLSYGEKTKILLVAMFLKRNAVLLIDEPTNHLDVDGRKKLAQYLNNKNSYILVSHDRRFMDRCIDHILSINRHSIEVIQGNYTSWKLQKEKKDIYEQVQNQRLLKDIKHLQKAKEQTERWSNKVEASKIGNHVGDRGRVGHLAAKMMKRSKVIEKHRDIAIEKKRELLNDVEEFTNIKLNTENCKNKNILRISDLTVQYDGRKVCRHVSFDIKDGDRIALCGVNGSGKSSILKNIIGELPIYSGEIWIQNDIKISYVPQDMSYLKGSLSEFAYENNVDYTLLINMLRKFDFPKRQYEIKMQFYSDGQKKKVLLAKSIIEGAKLFIWDEPLNYVDLFTRQQIENMILKYNPTMLFIEHDEVFINNIATCIIKLETI